MSDSETTYQPVVINSEELPKNPEVNAWDWIKFYVYNLVRKPAVWRNQKRLINLYSEIKLALEAEVLRDIKCHGITCADCRNAYAALKHQIFLSSIEKILLTMACVDHIDLYANFHRRYQDKFRESEEIAAWINGFKRK